MMSKVDIMWFMSDLAIILYCRYYFPLHFINAYYFPFMFSLNKEYTDFRKKCELFWVQKKFLNSKNILVLKSVQFLRDPTKKGQIRYGLMMMLSAFPL